MSTEIDLGEGEMVEIMTKEEKFWTDVVTARERDLEMIEQNKTYNQAILEMAKQKLLEVKK